MALRTPIPAAPDGSDAQAPEAEEEQRRLQIEKNRPLSELLRCWLAESDEDVIEEQRETWDYLRRALDEDRLSNRRLFP